jgi:hypothetical protein
VPFNGIQNDFNVAVNSKFCSIVEQMRRLKRSDAEEKQFSQLALLCGVRLDKLSKRKRRGYRKTPIKSFS